MFVTVAIEGHRCLFFPILVKAAFIGKDLLDEENPKIPCKAESRSHHFTPTQMEGLKAWGYSASKLPTEAELKKMSLGGSQHC